MIIAIDGTAASGKGTLASKLAERLNLAHLDTGILYRAVALKAVDAHFTPETITASKATILAEELDLSATDKSRLRHPEVSAIATVIAAFQGVRDALYHQQKKFATTNHEGYDGTILDGRDIGTVVLPDADYKFFVDADIKIRAERRYKELINMQLEVMLPDVLADLEARDYRDKNRDIAPLKPAEDAILVDTSNLDVDAMIAFALAYIKP